MDEFVKMSPARRTAMGNQIGGGSANSAFDPVTGLPTRVPQNPQEAVEWQFRAAEWARKKNESMLQNATAAMRYGIGMAGRSSPYGLSQMISPYLRQMGSQYMNMQYNQPDYSAFLRSGQGGSSQTTVSSRLISGRDPNWRAHTNIPQENPAYGRYFQPTATAPQIQSPGQSFGFDPQSVWGQAQGGGQVQGPPEQWRQQEQIASDRLPEEVF